MKNKYTAMNLIKYISVGIIGLSLGIGGELYIWGLGFKDIISDYIAVPAGIICSMITIVSIVRCIDYLINGEY